MKTILFLFGVSIVFATTGCLVTERGHYRGHRHYEDRPAVEVRGPVLEVVPPAIIVH